MSSEGVVLPAERLVNEAFARELASRQNADGGWGAAPGAPSNTECTALARLALSTEGAGQDTAQDTALTWLLAGQDRNGAWRYYPDGPAVHWPTAIALLALRSSTGQRTAGAGAAGAAEAVERGFAWLVEQRGDAPGWWFWLREWLSDKQTVELNPRLDGWPWTAGAAAWVEPTAWAVLALKAQWPGKAPRAIRGRIREGEAMIRDRECPGGGWNYGNKRVLEQDLEPYPDTTALALLALRRGGGGGSSDLGAVERGFGALDRLLDEHASGLALSLGVLSRRAWDRDATALKTRLAHRYEAGASPGENRTLALAVLAFAPTSDWLGGAGSRRG